MSSSIEIFNRKMTTLQPPPWKKKEEPPAKIDKDKEIARLREALEVILDAAQKDDPCIQAIRAVAYTALKGGK